jgi:hypothetical protein
MAKKKTTAPEKQYIAFDENSDTVILIGTLKEVGEAIEEYADSEGFDVDEVSGFIKVYELGPQKDLEVYPGRLEVVICS